MAGLWGGEGAPGVGASDRRRPEIEAAVEAYLGLAHGDARAALALAANDAIEAAKLVSAGYARWGQPPRRRAERDS